MIELVDGLMDGRTDGWMLMYVYSPIMEIKLLLWAVGTDGWDGCSG